MLKDSLRKIRTEKGLKQTELAEMSGVFSRTISLIELGKISPTIATLEKIAKALDVTVEDLIK